MVVWALFAAPTGGAAVTTMLLRGGNGAG